MGKVIFLIHKFKALDPKMMQQLGGMGNVMEMMKQMGKMEGLGDMMKMMGGLGGGKK